MNRKDISALGLVEGLALLLLVAAAGSAGRAEDAPAAAENKESEAPADPPALLNRTMLITNNYVHFPTIRHSGFIMPVHMYI